MKAKLICLTGLSGSGKSSTIRALPSKYPDKLRIFKYCTNRPKRTENEDGYIFCEFTENENQNSVEVRKYRVEYGDAWVYWTRLESFMQVLNDTDHVYIVDACTAQYVSYYDYIKKNNLNIDVYNIILFDNLKDNYDRLMMRCMKDCSTFGDTHLAIKEANRRFLTDIPQIFNGLFTEDEDDNYIRNANNISVENFDSISSKISDIINYDSSASYSSIDYLRDNMFAPALSVGLLKPVHTYYDIGGKSLFGIASDFSGIDVCDRHKFPEYTLFKMGRKFMCRISPTINRDEGYKDISIQILSDNSHIWETVNKSNFIIRMF